jgi:hypothetical protein
MLVADRQNGAARTNAQTGVGANRRHCLVQRLLNENPMGAVPAMADTARRKLNAMVA